LGTLLIKSTFTLIAASSIHGREEKSFLLGLWGSEDEISHYYKSLNLKTAPQAALKNPF
jgi:hypothetical protein